MSHRLPVPVLLLAMATAGAAGTAAGCGRDLKYRIDDGSLVAVPPAERQPIAVAQADVEKARQERDRFRGLAAEARKEAKAAEKEKSEAEDEVDRQKVEREKAAAEKNPDRVNAAAHGKALAALRLRAAEARVDHAVQRRTWLTEAADAADAWYWAAQAKVELERARIAQKKGLRPDEEFNPAEFEAQWNEANEEWEKERKQAKEAEKRAGELEARWKRLAEEHRAFAGS